MKVTIIPADKVVVKNGFALDNIPMDGIPSDIHAIQFDGNEGWIEYINKPQQRITNLTQFQRVIDRFDQEKMMIDEINRINEMRKIDPYYGMSEEEKTEKFKNYIIERAQDRLDFFAMTRGYDGILSCASYATSTDEKFRIEGEYCVRMRDETWSKLYQLLNDILEGERPIPKTFEEIEPELPELNWPN